MKDDDKFVDSDDEYREREDFLRDKLVHKPDVESKSLVLYYLRFFLTLKNGIADPIAKKDFKTKVNSLIDSTKKEIALMEHQRPSSSASLSLETAVYDDWLVKNV